MLVELFDPFIGMQFSFSSFECEGKGNDPYGQDPELLGDLGNDRCSSCPGT